MTTQRFFEFRTSTVLELPDDFSLAATSALELFDALMNAENVCGWHIFLVEPQPGAPETWPDGQAKTPYAWLVGKLRADQLELFCSALWEATNHHTWKGPCKFALPHELVQRWLGEKL